MISFWNRIISDYEQLNYNSSYRPFCIVVPFKARYIRKISDMWCEPLQNKEDRLHLFHYLQSFLPIGWRSILWYRGSAVRDYVTRSSLHSQPVCSKWLANLKGHTCTSEKSTLINVTLNEQFLKQSCVTATGRNLIKWWLNYEYFCHLQQCFLYQRKRYINKVIWRYLTDWVRNVSFSSLLWSYYHNKVSTLLDGFTWTIKCQLLSMNSLELTVK